MNSLSLKPDANINALCCALNFIFLLLGFTLIWIVKLAVLNVTAALIFSALWIVLIFLPFAIYIPAFSRSREYSLDDDAIHLKNWMSSLPSIAPWSRSKDE